MCEATTMVQGASLKRADNDGQPARCSSDESIYTRGRFMGGSLFSEGSRDADRRGEEGRAR